MMKHSFHISPMRNMQFLLTMLFLWLCSAAAFAAPDYVATVPCTGQPTLTPPENIIRTQGQTGAKEFEIKAAPGVTVKVKEWRLEGTSVTDTTMSNWGQFQVLNDNKTMNWTLGAEAEGEFTLTALIRRGCGDGGGEGEDEVIELWSGEVVAAELQLESVTFGGGNHTIYRDTGSQAAYPSPHWQKDRTENGQPFQSPVCYTRNSNFSVSATFSVTPEEADQAVKVKGVASSYIFGPKEVTPDGSTVTFPMTAANNPLPNNIRPGDSFNITWYFSTDDGENWEMAGDNQTDASSANQLYVTLGDPDAKVLKLFHTLVHIGCSRNTGQTDPDTVLNNVWSEFSDRSVSLVGASGPMTYYGEIDVQNYYVGQLFRDGDGQCGAWADFFLKTLQAQGIDYTNEYVFLKPLNALGFIVKNWNFASVGYSGIVEFPYMNIADSPFIQNNAYQWKYAEVTDLSGIPGQGPTINPASLFNNHQQIYIAINGTYYDPSYGIQFHSLAEIDDLAIEGYYSLAEGDVFESTLNVDLNGDGDMQDSFHAIAHVFKKNDPGLDLKVEPHER